MTKRMSVLRERFMDRPIRSSYAFANGGVIQATICARLPQGKNYSIDNNKYNFPCVRLLLLRGRPPAIFRAIPRIIINAVYGMLGRRPSPHISKEILETPPPIAYRDPSTTVVFKSSIHWVSTPLNHIAPRSIFCRPAHAMRCIGHSGLAEPVATATHFRLVPPKVGRGNRHTVTAVAFAYPPKRISWGASVNFYGGKPAISGPSSIYERGHGP